MYIQITKSFTDYTNFWTSRNFSWKIRFWTCRLLLLPSVPELESNIVTWKWKIDTWSTFMKRLSTLLYFRKIWSKFRLSQATNLTHQVCKFYSFFRLSACLIAILSVQICSAALPQNGAHDFDEFSAQEPQPIAPSAGKSSLTRNRVSNRAIAPNVAIPRSNPQLKSHLVIIFVNKPTSNSRIKLLH